MIVKLTVNVLYLPTCVTALTDIISEVTTPLTIGNGAFGKDDIDGIIVSIPVGALDKYFATTAGMILNVLGIRT